MLQSVFGPAIERVLDGPTVPTLSPLGASVRSRAALRRAALAVTGALALGMASWATPASAYVVVTVDNRVYDVPTKPEIRGDMVLFVLDGSQVSLRVYEVNVTKTNELNYLLDQGAGAPSLTAQLRALRPALPADERLLVSSRLHQVLEEESRPNPRLVLAESRDERPSFQDAPGASGRGSDDFAPRRDEPGPRSRFSREAREALAEAERQVRAPADSTSAPLSSTPASRDDVAMGPARGGRDVERAAELDAEIASEQEYLRRLTAGEVVVSDLEGEIDRTMDRIRRLQRRRDRVGAAEAAAAGAATSTSSYTPSGSWPAGSREARWERELAEARTRLESLRGQQAGLPAGASRDREMTDELIGETQYEIDKLERRLSRAR